MNTITMLVMMIVMVLPSTNTMECSANQMEYIIAQGSQEGCWPRKVIVKVPYESDDYQLMAPTHVEVRRCQGSCGHFHHSCIPETITKRKIPVIFTEKTVEQGVTASLCGEVEVEDHERCQCGCPLKEQHCTAAQVFLPYECRCSCINLGERDSCLDKGWHWDRDTCQCMCPGRPYPACPSSYVFDYSTTCSCVELQNSAFLELEVVLLVFSLCLVGGILSFLQCYRSKTGLFQPGRAVHTVSKEMEDFLPRLSEENEKTQMISLGGNSIEQGLLKDQR